MYINVWLELFSKLYYILNCLFFFSFLFILYVKKLYHYLDELNWFIFKIYVNVFRLESFYKMHYTKSIRQKYVTHTLLMYNINIIYLCIIYCFCTVMWKRWPHIYGHFYWTLDLKSDRRKKQLDSKRLWKKTKKL